MGKHFGQKILCRGMMALFVFAFVLGTSGAHVAHAASLTVTNTNDSGSGSLRQVITEAQPGDTITFDPGLAGQTITLTSGRLFLNKNLTIIGLGASQLAISGNHSSQVFEVSSGITATVQGLTIRDASGHLGGGINNAGKLTVTDTTFSNNSATYAGGSIYNTGILIVTGSHFNNNSADVEGGGIYNTGTMTVNNSAFTGNSASSFLSPIGIGHGGGISNRGSLTITGSTVSGNYAESSGGGIYTPGTLIISDSTLSGNSVSRGGIGGGILNGGTATLSGSTIKDNIGPNGGGGIFNGNTFTATNATFSGNSSSTRGGAIFNRGGAFTLTSSTFKGNSAASQGGAIFNEFVLNLKNSLIMESPSGGNCVSEGAFNVSGVNFADDNTCTGSTQVTSAQLNVGSLADNGGPTQTIALQPGSVAIDAALDCTDHNSTSLSTDQRGVTRPQGSACDVGAFELEQSDTTAPTITITTPAESTTYLLGQAVNADYACQDEADGSGLASCVGSVADGSPIDTSSIGPKAFTVTAADHADNTVSLTHNYSVVYDFSGFFQPVDNFPVLNTNKAGSAIQVEFSLSGNQGLIILAAGYPVSQRIECASGAALGATEPTSTPGKSQLSYDPTTDTYSYGWNTEKAWAGTCRQLIVKLTDGTEHMANFKFK